MQSVDPCERRGRCAELALEALERVRLSLNFDRHSFPIVDHEAAQLMARREGVHERAEADALNDASNGDAVALHRERPTTRGGPAEAG
jgi:hypothetical protein